MGPLDSQAMLFRCCRTLPFGSSGFVWPVLLVVKGQRIQAQRLTSGYAKCGSKMGPLRLLGRLARPSGSQGSVDSSATFDIGDTWNVVRKWVRWGFWVVWPVLLVVKGQWIQAQRLTSGIREMWPENGPVEPAKPCRLPAAGPCFLLRGFAFYAILLVGSGYMLFRCCGAVVPGSLFGVQGAKTLVFIVDSKHNVWHRGARKWDCWTGKVMLLPRRCCRQKNPGPLLSIKEPWSPAPPMVGEQVTKL